MKIVNVHQAKTQLSRLLRAVASGEEIIIANRGVPVARLSPAAKEGPKRKLGDMAGQIWISDDFDAPLSGDLLGLFEGRQAEKPKRWSKRSNRIA
jgi:prevent-host-death family protein